MSKPQMTPDEKVLYDETVRSIKADLTPEELAALDDMSSVEQRAFYNRKLAERTATVRKTTRTKRKDTTKEQFQARRKKQKRARRDRKKNRK